MRPCFGPCSSTNLRARTQVKRSKRKKGGEEEDFDEDEEDEDDEARLGADLHRMKATRHDSGRAVGLLWFFSTADQLHAIAAYPPRMFVCRQKQRNLAGEACTSKTEMLPTDIHLIGVPHLRRAATSKVTRTRTWRMMTQVHLRRVVRLGLSRQCDCRLCFRAKSWTLHSSVSCQGCDHQIYESVIDLRDKRQGLMGLRWNLRATTWGSRDGLGK